MIKCRHQLNVLTEQHAITEDITTHIADANHGEVIGLGINTKLTKMPLDRLPGTACGDTHGFVVITVRAT
ncbi:unannotated protein [freshwater metagenome]|uniref:Unannotated protein n=1 Tax=freshwater metagenome TaxID=449393 RepID=A0A6J7AL22_9ZZZZ